MLLHEEALDQTVRTETPRERKNKLWISTDPNIKVTFWFICPTVIVKIYEEGI